MTTVVLRESPEVIAARHRLILAAMDEVRQRRDAELAALQAELIRCGGCTCSCRWCRDGRHEFCDSGCRG